MEFEVPKDLRDRAWDAWLEERYSDCDFGGWEKYREWLIKEVRK